MAEQPPPVAEQPTQTALRPLDDDDLPGLTQALEEGLATGQVRSFSLPGGESWIVGRVRFSCRGSGECQVDIQRKSANLIDIEYSGRVTAEVLATRLLAVANTRSAQGNAVRKVGGYLKEATRDTVPSEVMTGGVGMDKAGVTSAFFIQNPSFVQIPSTYRKSGGVPDTNAGRFDLAQAQVNHPQGGAREYIFQRTATNSFKTGDTGVTQDSLPSIGIFEGAALRKDSDGTHVHMWSNRAEGADPDYLTFGYWLDSTSFGAFSMGAGRGWTDGLSGNAVARFNTFKGLTGSATYRGPAAGLHATAQEVRQFTARADLTANFGDATEAGSLSGRIHSIVSGGAALSSSYNIGLLSKEFKNFSSTNNPKDIVIDSGVTRSFAGAGTGHWEAVPVGPRPTTGADSAKHPPAFIGTFGVSVGTGGTQESFVGAFATEKE